MYQTNGFNHVAQRTFAPPARPGRQAAAATRQQDAATERESLSENFNREIEAWARHALGANGFGDYS